MIALTAPAASPAMAASAASATAAAMPELADVLEQLGLSAYLRVLEENGFWSWSTILDITEDDLTALQFKLGHRRALQREIATYRGVPLSLSLPPDASPPRQYTAVSASALETLARQTSTLPPREKRRYKRHPKPDPNAPKRPKTGYVNFVDNLRKDPGISQLSFAEITKEVGRRWQELPQDQKRVWESEAARARQIYERRMDEYKETDQYRKYNVYLSNFKTQQAPSAPRKRSSASRSLSNGARESSHASPDSLRSAVSPPLSSSASDVEACGGSLNLVFSELSSLRGEILNNGTRPYDRNNLPPEDLVRRSIHAFIQGTGSLIYMWTYSQGDELLNRIYHSPETSPDAMTLAECFTIAAMGAHYDIDCFPDHIRKLIYASGTIHFHEKMARQDYPRTMRLLLSMSFYGLLEKHMSARYLIAAGLQIARWKCPAIHTPSSETGDENSRKIFRSLIFMDSWLSYTLGYESEATPSDVQTACRSNTTVSDDINLLVHTQTSKIGLLAAEIARTLASPELATRGNITILTQKLEAWHEQVPAKLQISTLLDVATCPPNLTMYQRRAILMVHIMYFGALILLYRQLLVATAENQLRDVAASSLTISAEDTQTYRSECALAARSIARLLKVISFDGTLSPRCWLVIYWAFTAAIVLLFTTTTRLLEGQSEGVEENLEYARDCMDMLEPCRSFEPIAARYLDTLWPLYDSLRSKHQRLIGRAKTSIFSLLQADPDQLGPAMTISKEEMSPISEELALLLIDPFGRKQNCGDGSMRRVLNNDGSCTVFWFG